LLITDLPCDLDIYALDSSCDPYSGCLHGSTAPFAVDDEVVFECTAGETHYIVIEAYGVEHLNQASGPCTDDGTSSGTVFDPSYTLSFDVSASTGCFEDCDDGLDNDLDGAVDCSDSDCGLDPVCCDLDGDGFFSEECGGEDCDDNDADINPIATDVPDNGVDEDCTGADSETPDSGDGMEDTGADGESKDDERACGCSVAPGSHPAALWSLGILGFVGLMRRRR
jgi:MYXO-CTERM domain-containing protein